MKISYLARSKKPHGERYEILRGEVDAEEFLGAAQKVIDRLCPKFMEYEVYLLREETIDSDVGQN